MDHTKQKLKTKLLGTACTIALGAAFGMAAPGAANAALSCTPGNLLGAGTCTETVSIGPQPTDYTDQILTLDKWLSNASAGFLETLQDVRITESGALTSSGTLRNTSTSTQSFTFTLSEDLSFDAGPGSPSGFLPSTVTVSNSSGAVPFTLAAGASTPFSTSFIFGPTVPVVDATALAQLTGPGTFEALNSTSTFQTVVGGGGNITSSLTTLVTADISLTYDFTNSLSTPPAPVPEPSSMVMLGSGLMALVAIRRRRRG